MDKSSVTVNSAEYIALCCMDMTAVNVPNNSIVWMKDGVQVSHSVRSLTTDSVTLSFNR